MIIQIRVKVYQGLPKHITNEAVKHPCYCPATTVLYNVTTMAAQHGEGLFSVVMWLELIHFGKKMTAQSIYIVASDPA